MAKRKRSEASPVPSDSAPAAEKLLKRQRKAVSARLTAAQKPLVAALRLGAGFERQKHSRRKKTAVQKKDTNALTRLDDEYRVLKALDLDKVAEQHVRRTIAKIKRLKDHEALPEDTKQVEKADLDTARLNVLARLYKVAAVKKEVDALIEDLKDILGSSDVAGKAERAAQLQGPDQREKKRKHAAEDAAAAVGDDMDMLDISDEDSVAARLFNARIAAPSSGEDSDGDLSDDERPASIEDSDSDARDPDADLAAAGGSSTGSFDGFSDDGSNSDAPLDRSIASPSDTEHSDSASSISLDAVSKSKSAKDAAKPSTSTFLPGLSHAAYFSGDESASDLDEKPRKNRRGQRARQKLAEMKYGAKAKHIEKNERKQGWDAKRGAVSSDARPGNRRDRRAAEKDLKAKGGRGPVISGENAAPLGKKRDDGAASKPVPKKQAPIKDDTGPLHPSWAAAKAAKESKKLKIDLRGAKSAKKITFD